MQDITTSLLESARSGNARDIEYIFSVFRPSITSCAAKLRTDYFDFEDAVQEGNIGLFKAILGYRDNRNASFTTYAKKCILNSMLSARAESTATKHMALNSALPLEESILLQSFENDYLIREQDMEFIRIARQTLSKFEFLVFSLYMRQYSYKEIASMTGRTEKAINNAIQRIHKKLRK